MKKTFVEQAEEWLKIHYPKQEGEIDPKWSAVINFALWLDKRN